MDKKVLITATVQSHIAQFHKPLINLLKENGYEVHIAAKNNLAEKNGLQIENADAIYDIPFSRSPKSTDNIRAYKQLKEIIDKNKYAIIHCNTPMGGIVTRLAARKSRKIGTKVYYTAHGFHFYKGAPLKNWIVYYPIEKCFAKFTDKLITITKEDYRLASEKFKTDVQYMHGVGVDGNRYHDVEDKSEQRNQLGYKDDEFICICTGELNKNKNQSFILELMPELVKKIPNIKLLLAGNGPYENILKETVSKNSLENNVGFLGYTTKLEQYVQISDVVLSASIREGMPLNIIEAMLCKKPVVACENRGHRELICSGDNGFLIKQGDSSGFADAVYMLYSDGQLRNKIGNQAFESIGNYEIGKVKDELSHIYELKQR